MSNKQGARKGRPYYTAVSAISFILPYLDANRATMRLPLLGMTLEIAATAATEVAAATTTKVTT
jgi:hypothetical protein